MEKITRNNYEAFYLDFIEGNLSDEDIVLLEEFMLQHEELAIELDFDLKNTVLVKEEIRYEEKPSLKQGEEDLAITPFNVNLYMAMSVENQLTEPKEKELHQYIHLHGLQSDYAYFGATKLQPDTTVIFEDKRSLKQKNTPVIPLYMRIVSAAAVVAIAFTVIAQYFSTETDYVAESAKSVQQVKPPSQLHVNTVKWLVIDFSGSSSASENKVQLEQNRKARKQALPVEIIEKEMPLAQKKELRGSENNEEKQFEQEEPKLEPVPLKEMEDFDDFANVMKPSNERPSVQADQETQPAAPKTKVTSEQPFKVITDVAGNAIKKDVTFERDKKESNENYVAYRFKVGGFEFERKVGH